MENNNLYLEKMITDSEVTIDTASILNPGFGSFVSRNAELLRGAGAKIFIPKEVRMEFIRHFSSPNAEQAHCANIALETLSEYSDIFFVEPGTINDEDVMKAFADRVILSELNVKRGTASQLLITNDKSLASDAYQLNNQLSCKGHRVKVCYLDDFGNLCRCACTKEEAIWANTKAEDKKASESEQLPSIEKPQVKECNNTSDGYLIVSGLIASFSVGIAIGKFIL